MTIILNVLYEWKCIFMSLCVGDRFGPKKYAWGRGSKGTEVQGLCLEIEGHRRGRSRGQTLTPDFRGKLIHFLHTSKGRDQNNTRISGGEIHLKRPSLKLYFIRL